MYKYRFLALMKLFVSINVNEVHLFDKTVVVNVDDYLVFGSKIDLKERTFGVSFKTRGCKQNLASYVFVCNENSIRLYERQPETLADRMDLFDKLTTKLLAFLEKTLTKESIEIIDCKHITYEHDK